MQREKLKLGLLLDSFQVPAWVYSSIQCVLKGTSAEIKLVILNDDFEGTKFTNRSNWVYSIFNRIDERLFTKEPNPFAPKNSLDLIGGVPFIKARLIHIDNSCFLKEADVRKIAECQLDILIKFGFECLSCEPLNISKYGTWFYLHGDERKWRGGPPGYWEVVENRPETSSALMAVGGKPLSTRVLFRSDFFTYPVSPARHRSYYFWATTPFLQRQIEFLYQHGEEKLLLETEKFNTHSHPDFQNITLPSNYSAAVSIAKITKGLIKEILHRIFYLDQWFLLFSLKQDEAENYSEFEMLRPSKDKFWADPHVINVNGIFYIFIEEFSYKKNKGHISVIELDESGSWSAPVKVLEKEYHLSYPYIFKWNDKFYMIPESGENRTIDIYQCVDFPNKWEFKQNLMKNVKALDTTLLQYNSKWWLFTAMAENEAAAPHVELFLYYSDDPLSKQWNAHPQNPVISDVKRARPAGDLFIKDGKLYRPSQDCSRGYGYGFDLNEIVTLTETEYVERKVSSTRPGWERSIIATHTYARLDNLTVIDALTRRFRWA